VTSRPGPATAGTTVADWLLPLHGETRLRLEQVVTQAAEDRTRVSRLRTLRAVARRALVEEVEVKLRSVLGETLTDLVIAGWKTHTMVAAAVRASLDEPAVDQIVPLRDHAVTAHRQHHLVVRVDGVKALTLTTWLGVRLQLAGAIAVVRDGRVVAVRSGQVRAKGVVKVEGVEVARRGLVVPLTAELTRQPATT
jgi:hypothetical protein